MIIVMPMYQLIQYSYYYAETSEGLFRTKYWVENIEMKQAIK